MENPDEILYDPEMKALEPLPEKSLKPISGEDYMRQCGGIVRGICKKRGIDESMVPVIHRVNKRPDGKSIFRYWDVRQGRSGASNYCIELCSEQWRIATKEEEAAGRTETPA